MKLLKILWKCYFNKKEKAKEIQEFAYANFKLIKYQSFLKKYINLEKNPEGTSEI